jgi:glycosyltransferase involved in cell wall biosynthesis
MKIFQICNKSPYPPSEGGPIAMNTITMGLLEAGHQIKILTANTPKYFISPKKIPEDYLKKVDYESVYINTNVRIDKAFINLFSNNSYHVERFISDDFDNKIKQILLSSQFDIVQLESIFVAPYIDTIRKYSSAKIILRAHNIEHQIWERLAASCINPIKRLYLNHLAKTLKKFELDILNKVDGIAAITKHDADYFFRCGISKPIIFIPIGIDPEKIPTDEKSREFPGLFHLGSMDWIPNQEGIKWFLQNVWGQLINEHPDLQLQLAGRNMPGWLCKNKIKGVAILGEINNAFEFLQSKTVMIVPLLSGSGMRVKIIEGMACGNTIISSSVGAEGINFTDGENILIADKPKDFIMQINKCINDPVLCSNIGRQAKKLVALEYNNNKIIERLIEFYKQLLHTVA